MTNRTLVAAVFLVGCAAGGVSSQFVVPRASAQQAATLQRWEYTCTPPGEEDIVALANQLGAQRWELATVRAKEGSIHGRDHDVYCFKRPKL